MKLESILVIYVARIGDTALLTPCLKAIKARHPQARLTVLAHPKRQCVLENLPCIDSLGGISKQRAAWRGWLPGREYDAAIVFGRDAALVRYALRVARRVACFAEPEFVAIANRRLTRIAHPAGPTHAVPHRLLLAEALDVHAVGDQRLAYVVTPAEREAAERLLAARGIAGRRPRIGLQLFSFPAKAHRDWPVGHFDQLIARLLEVHPGAQFLVLGDALAARQATSLVERYPQAVSVVAGELGLRESVAMMASLDLYIGVDTGPTHLAGALGIPMVALYHWKYPGANLQPLQNPACRVIEHPATHDPSADRNAGMEAIPVAAVLAAALDALAPAPAGWHLRA